MAFLRNGQFTLSDLDASEYEPESQARFAERFMCFFRSAPGLLAVKYDGEPAKKVSLDSIYKLSDQQYFRGVCRRYRLYKPLIFTNILIKI